MPRDGWTTIGGRRIRYLEFQPLFPKFTQERLRQRVAHYLAPHPGSGLRKCRSGTDESTTSRTEVGMRA